MKSKQTINFSVSYNFQTFNIFLSHLSLIISTQLVQPHYTKDGDDMKHTKILFITILFLLCATLIGWKSISVKNNSDSSSSNESMQSKIKKIYNVANQSKIASSLNKEKQNPTYTEDNMFVKYNPYGTNTQSLYVYFTTEDAVKVSYTVHVDDSFISDFTRNVAQSSTYQTIHEFQIIGLIPNSNNEITITLTKKNGSSVNKTMNYELGNLLGDEEVKLKTDISDATKLSDGLYVILGNDSENTDFMYYYDNEGVLRGEVPILGYRSHRLIFNNDTIYYSISESKMAQVNNLGQVTNVFDLGQYKLHHDYVFDKKGNLLILATDTTQDSVEDVIIKLNPSYSTVSKVVDLGDLLPKYKSICKKNSDNELDWMHINTIQYTKNDSLILSSRETSSIIKLKNISSAPEIDYMIGDSSFWKNTGYEDLLYTKKGDFTIQGGQHTVTYEEDSSLKDGQYYLYMYNNNIGISETRSDFDWSSIGLTNSKPYKGTTSYYYKYLVDEKKHTFELVDSFKVPYSGYVSSVQKMGNNTVIDSGFKGIFSEYDSDHKKIASFKMNMEKYIYRVYKYDFDGFYFSS